MSIGPSRGSAGRMAGGLGWFSIGLGLIEIAAARPVARTLGMRGQEALIRAYGAREIATGIGILLAQDRRPWIMGRVAGDALDAATLLANAPGNRNPGGLTFGLLSVLGVTLFDLVCAEALRTEEGDRQRRARAALEYRSRSAFRRPPAEMRGAANDATIPDDMRTPEALKPWVAA